MIDPYLRKEAPTVAVYNASGKAGFATTVGDVLAGYGYKVLAKETSQSNQSKTTVIRMTKTAKPFTERFLSVRFKTVVIGKTLPANVVPAKTTPTNTTSTDSTSTTPTRTSNQITSLFLERIGQLKPAQPGRVKLMVSCLQVTSMISSDW
jgi:hypothetical protein